MAKRVSKEFSTVRYWRYVFTPILFVCFFIGIYMLYADSPSPGAPPFIDKKASFSNVLGNAKKFLNLPR